MPSLSPFSITTTEPPDRLTAYWRSLCCKAGYRDDATLLRQLVVAAGGSDAHRVNLPFPLPNAVWLCEMNNNGLMILVNGTTNPAQHIASALGGVFRVQAGQAGRVNGFFGSAAEIIAATIRPALLTLNPAQIIFVGHSLGGAVAQIMAASPSDWPVAGCWTLAQPRVGNLAWVNAYPVPNERWTTPGDPAPMLPPATSVPVDIYLFPLFPPIPASYRHTPFRWHVWQDGVVEQFAEESTWIEGSSYLVNVALGSQGWVGAHDCSTYACRIRSGIPVRWAVEDGQWPLLDVLDPIFSELLGGAGRRCPNELFTDRAAHEPSGPRFAQQGICS